MKKKLILTSLLLLTANSLFAATGSPPGSGPTAPRGGITPSLDQESIETTLAFYVLNKNVYCSCYTDAEDKNHDCRKSLAGKLEVIYNKGKRFFDHSDPSTAPVLADLLLSLFQCAIEYHSKESYECCFASCLFTNEQEVSSSSWDHFEYLITILKEHCPGKLEAAKNFIKNFVLANKDRVEDAIGSDPYETNSAFQYICKLLSIEPAELASSEEPSAKRRRCT